MLCQRCSHPLPPLADRCLRCLALNPSETPLPAQVSIASDPPPPLDPAAEAHGRIDWHQMATDTPQPLPAPAPARPAWTTAPPMAPVDAPTAEFAVPSDARLARRGPASPAAEREARVPAAAQLFAWSVDFGVLFLCAALHVGLATWLFGPARLAPQGAASADYWLDLLLRGPRLRFLWLAHGALLAVAYSWLFAALGGRTPGLALAGLRLESVRGGSLTVREALARAGVAIPSAALGLCGFALALLDPRGQTLHDKVAGAILVRAPRP